MFGIYQEAGWQLCRILAGTKGPFGYNWNATAATSIPEGDNAGLLHSMSGTCAIDVDDLPLATAWLADRGIDLQALLDAPDAVQIISGNAGHAKLLYALPSFMAMPSKKIVIDGKTAVEFRCASAHGKSVQDVLPPSMHPSGSFYQWGGRGNWQALPPLPNELFVAWEALLQQEKAASVSMGEHTLPANWAEVREALATISPNCSRKQWIECGMGIHDIATKLGNLDEAFVLWDEWSAGAPLKYKASEMAAQWRSFKTKPDGVTVASLFHHATTAGWRRAQVDVSGFFKPVPQPHDAVKASIGMSQRVPIVDLSLWPTTLRTRAEEVAAEVGCDPIVPLIAGLAAVSAAADKRITLDISDTWQVPPTVWLMTIGEPADKKTPGSKPMFQPLRQLEVDDKPKHAAEMMGWQGKEARFAAQAKAMREWQASPEADLPNAVPPRQDDLPPEPQPLRLLVQDATSQKFVSMASGRPRGFLLWLDEMHKWLSKLADPRNPDDRGCWIQGYETGPYTMDRQMAGSIHAENLALSIYGNCQPTVFRTNVAAAAADGMVQRFLPVVIDRTRNGMWQQSVPPFMSTAKDYEALLRRTYSLPVMHYTMTPEANELFRGFCRWALDFRDMERTLQASDAYQTALGKVEGQCGRIMLLFHLIREPYATTVSAETAKAAIDLMRRFFVPSLRYAFVEVGQQRDRVGETIADYLLQAAGVKEKVSLAELRAKVKHVTDGKDPMRVDLLIKVAMDELVALNYGAILVDHPRYPTWSINPTIAEQFKAERAEVIRVKQAMLDRMAEALTLQGTPPSVPMRATGAI